MKTLKKPGQTYKIVRLADATFGSVTLKKSAQSDGIRLCRPSATSYVSESESEFDRVINVVFLEYSFEKDPSEDYLMVVPKEVLPMSAKLQQLPNSIPDIDLSDL